MKKNVENIVDEVLMSKIRMSFFILQLHEKDNLVCAEIGTWVGENAKVMLDIDSTMKLHVIDAYTNIGVTDDLSEGTSEEVKEKARVRLAPYGERVKFVYKQSEDVYLDYPDEFFDYVYIDGDHSYFGCYRDIKIWWPKVKKGGVLAGHDINMQSVSKAVIDFGCDTMLLSRISRIEGAGQSDWMVVK